MKIFSSLKQAAFLFIMAVGVGLCAGGDAKAGTRTQAGVNCTDSAFNIQCIRDGGTCTYDRVTDVATCETPDNVPEMSTYVAGALLLAGAGFILYRRRQLKIG